MNEDGKGRRCVLNRKVFHSDPETWSPDQSRLFLHNLKRQWAQVKTVNPEGETFRTMRKTIDKYPYEVLDQLAKNKINFVSYLAKKSLMDKHKMSLATVKKLYGGLKNICYND